MIKNNLLQNITEKILATLLIICLTFVNFVLVISYLTQGVITFAKENNLELQTSSTNHANVQFDAYFEIDNQKSHTIISDINQNPSIYLNLKVQKQGYLKNAKILFRDENQEMKTNFDLLEEQTQASTIQDINLEEKQIDLKQIDYDTEVVISMPIGLTLQEQINIDQLSKNNKVILQATYIDNQAEEIEISKEVTLNITWTQNNTLTLSSNIAKHVPYNINSQQGILLEQIIELQVQKQETENTLPVKKDTIIVDIPNYAGIYPEQIKVSAEKLTNGTQEIPEQNILIDEQAKQLQITVENQEQEGKIAVQNQELIKITYMYGQDAYNFKDQNNTITSNIKAQTEIYSGKTYNIETILEQQLTEKFGELVTYELSAIDSQISKGKMYANYINLEQKHETEYTTKWDIQISDTQVTESAGIKSEVPYCLTAQTEKQVNSYYKQTKINKQQLEKVLGQEGYIQVLDSQGNEIIIVNTTLPTDEQGNYIIKYEENTQNIQLITSKPINHGKIEIEHVKTVDVQQYSRQEVIEFTHLKEQITGLILYSGSNTYTQLETKQTQIGLTETNTKATLKLDKTGLSTLSENENIELAVELNNHLQTSDLYQNPVFEIEMPTYIENIIVNKASILYGDNLKVETVETNNNIIKVKLEGTQQDFSKGMLTNGSNVILDLSVKVNVLTPTITEKIKLRYYNENTTRYEQEEQNTMTTIQTNINGYSETQIQFISPTGLINVSSISNYNQSDVTVQSVEQGERTGKLEIYAPSKIAKVKNTVLNNTQEEIQDVTILGRIPHQNNKSILENTDLNSTFTASMVNNIKVENGINTENIRIFYSENENADRDINKVENGWTEIVQEYAKIKSYLIKIVDTNLQPSQVISFSYSIGIPENLEHNNSTYATFATYYTDVQDSMNVTAKEASKVGLTTGTGPVLNVLQTSKTENQNVTKDQRIKYSVTVTNEGQEQAEEVVAKITVPEITAYTYQTESGYQIDTQNKEIQIPVGSIAPNEQKIVEYEIQVLGTAKQDDKIECTTRITAKDLSKEMLSNTTTNTVVEQKIDIKEEFVTYSVKESDELQSSIYIENNTQEDLNNVVFTKTIPEELEYVKVLVDVQKEQNGQTIFATEELTEGVTFNEQTRELKIVYDTIEKGNNSFNDDTIVNNGSIKRSGIRLFDIITKVKKLPQDTYKAKISMISYIQADNTEKYSTNEKIITISKPKIVATMECSNVDKYLASNEEMEYTIRIQNQSDVLASLVDIEDIIPSELEILSIKYIREQAEVQENNIMSNLITKNISLSENEEYIIVVKVRAKDLSEETSIVNYATISIDGKVVSKTEEITHIIEKGNGTEDNDTNPENNNGNNNQNPNSTYNITGLVWLDQNSNGQKDEQEQLMSGITVKVLDSRNYSTIQQNTTNAQGEYKFSNLSQGEYVVLFIYDSVSYKPTEYQKNGTTQNKNSSAVEREVQNEGSTIKGAVTDIIKITNKSASNINLGLIKRETFDLELEKTVTKVTVQNSKGLQSYNFNESKLAKVEIDSKQIAGSNVIIEYKIKVKNTGNIAGYAKKIADYIPKDLTYSSELNPTWYLSADGILYNTELEQAIINPGETKELQLILTKKMTANNVGLINNTAEISENYNEKGIEDVDSKVANKSQAEDDIGLADVFIGIKTGTQTIVITVIISIIIIGIITSFIIIKKRGK